MEEIKYAVENMEAIKYAVKISKLKPETQDELFKQLRTILNEKEINALKIMVSYCHINGNAEYKKAIIETMAKELYKKFNEKEV